VTLRFYGDRRRGEPERASEDHDQATLWIRKEIQRNGAAHQSASPSDRSGNICSCPDPLISCADADGAAGSSQFQTSLGDGNGAENWLTTAVLVTLRTKRSTTRRTASVTWPTPRLTERR
jgi:hypothetical protein